MTKFYDATETPSETIPLGVNRISLVQDTHGDEDVFYQVEESDGSFYLCDADGDKVDLCEWTLLRTLADIPADDSDAFFAAIEETAVRSDEDDV